MPDVREVYEMITKQKPSEPGALERQQKRQVRSARNKKIGAFALAAAIAVVAVALILETRGGQSTRTPADQPSTVAPGTFSGPFFLNLRTRGTTPLAKNLAGGYSYVASPDGRRLAYSSSRDGGCVASDGVTVANIDGTGARTFKSPAGLTYCAARWSPDGTKVVYQERNGADPYSVGNLFVQEISTGRRVQVTDLKLSKAWWWFLSPSFTPDGRNVIFQMPRRSSEITKFDVWSAPVTGGEPTLVLRNASFPMLNPAGGPEGVAIAFVSPSPDNFAGRSIMTGRPVPGSDIRRTLLVEAQDSIWWPTFSPDGRQIAYQMGGSIYVVDVSFFSAAKSLKVASGNIAEWLDNDTLIVTP